MTGRGSAWGAVAAAVTAASTLRLLPARPPGGPARWTRTNHAGRPVTLLEGPAYVAGSVAGALAAGIAGANLLSAPAAVAGAFAGTLGLLDDLAGDGGSKGLRGHLGALRHGRVTTGAVKVVGLGATGLLTAVLVERAAAADRPGNVAPGTGPGRRAASAGSEPGRRAAEALSTVVAGGVVAGSANLVNLLDLRPGRALKAVLGYGLATAATGGVDLATAAAGGAALGCLRSDLAGRSMLGDTGANAAGALLGCSLIARAGPRGRLAALAVLTALTVASERISFTAVIESTPVLREIDALGR